MKLSVVILNYNVHYFLQLCLESVISALSDIDSEIIVIDNNSTDSSCEMVSQNFPTVNLIENNENIGFSKANNQAVTFAKGEFICILNPDTVVAEDTFKILLDFSEGRSNLGIVGCKLIDGRGKYLEESKRNLPVIKVAFQKQIGFEQSYYANQLGENETGKVPILVGAIMFMKRKVFNQVNGFDEDYFMYGEDIDLSYRVLKEGFDNYYLSDTTIIHFKGESTLKDKKYAKRFYGAMRIFYKKHFRRNIFYDTLIWIGVKISNLLPTIQKVIPQKINDYILISESDNLDLINALNKRVIRQSQVDSANQNDEIIFDANFISYKSIIDVIGNNALNERATFKILPKNSNFIIGSNSSKSRGEVLKFGI